MVKIQPVDIRRSLNVSHYGLSFEELKGNPIYIEPVDLRSGIRAELGKLFHSLNVLLLRPIRHDNFNGREAAVAKIDQIYEAIRQEVV